MCAHEARPRPVDKHAMPPSLQGMACGDEAEAKEAVVEWRMDAARINTTKKDTTKQR